MSRLPLLQTEPFMKNLTPALLLVAVALILGISLNFPLSAALRSQLFGDADIPAFARNAIDKEEFVKRRAEDIARMRGITKDRTVDPRWRPAAIRQMEAQENLVREMPDSAKRDALLASWTAIGPAPIPNGQVAAGASTPASGRTISVAIHPTNPDIVYVGTAQGGLYRSTNGGASWTPLMDGALRLAIGALTIDPANPETLYVGTGEANFSQASFFGVRASTGSRTPAPLPRSTAPLINPPAAQTFSRAAPSAESLATRTIPTSCSSPPPLAPEGSSP